MGDIADGMINGDFDHQTGEYLGTGGGYPRTKQYKESAEDGKIKRLQAQHNISFKAARSMLKYKQEASRKDNEIKHLKAEIEELKHREINAIRILNSLSEKGGKIVIGDMSMFNEFEDDDKVSVDGTLLYRMEENG